MARPSSFLQRLSLMRDWLSHIKRDWYHTSQRLRSLFFQLRQRALKRYLQNFIHLLNKVQLHLRLQQLRKIGQILAVFVGQNRLKDSRAVRCQQLLLQPSDRKHLAAQRNLTRHRKVAPHLYLS